MEQLHPITAPLKTLQPAANQPPHPANQFGGISKLSFFEWLMLAAILIANGLFLRVHAFRGFVSFDMGPFLDASWRVFCGQKPFVDFLYISGPVHLYMNAFFFLLFGFGKTAILLHVITVHSIVIVLTFLMARKFAPFHVAVLCALLSTACFYWPVSHPWHDQSAHLWGILAMAALLFHLPFEESNQAFRIGMLTGILATVSFMTKTNVGSLYVFIYFLTLLSGSKKWHALSGYGLGFGAAMLVFVILIGSPKNWFEQTFLTWNIPIQRARRTFFLIYIPTWFSQYYWIAIAIVWSNIKSHWETHQPLVTLYLGTAFLAIVAMCTGTMKQSANIPLWGIHLTLSFILLYQNQHYLDTRIKKVFGQASAWALKGLCIWLIAVAGYRGLRLETWTYGTINPFGTYPLKSKSVEGWMAPKEKGPQIDQLVEFIKTYIPKNESLLILTDLQILNPITGRESYKGIPFIWYDNEEPPPGKQLINVHNRILQNPPLWVITHRHADGNSFANSIIPYLGLQEFVMNDYVSVRVYDDYVVLHHK